MSRNRQTGTEITIEPSENIGGGWMTICEAHGDVCDFESKRQARSFAASPTDWCGGCYAAVTA